MVTNFLTGRDVYLAKSIEFNSQGTHIVMGLIDYDKNHQDYFAKC